MNYSEILVGAKLDIKLLSQVRRNDASEEKIFLSSVLDVKDNNDIVINMPQFGGRMVILPENVRYDLVFITPNGLFRSSGQVISKGKRGAFYVLVIKLNEELAKVQRREYFRLDVFFPLIFTTVDETTAGLPTMKEIILALEDTPPEKLVKGMGTILDISGGGLRFISTDKLHGVGYLALRFQLGEGPTAKYVEVACRLLNSHYKEDARKYEHRVKFIFKDNLTREMIIKFIFDEERRIRKKTLG